MTFSIPSLSWFQTALNLSIAFFVLLATVTASAFLIPKARLIRERTDAQDWNRRLEARLTTQSADLAAVLASVAALREEVAATRIEAADARAEALVTRKTLIIAFRHNAALIMFIRSRRPASEMPDLPAEISDGVLDELRAHELEAGAAIQGAAGVVTPGGAA